MIHTVKSFGMINKAEVDVFLKLSCFFHDSADLGNLISGSSAFSKSSLNIWKFMVHVLLRPPLENFEPWTSPEGQCPNQIDYTLCSQRWRSFIQSTWFSIQGCLALGEWSQHCGYLGHQDLFCFLVYSCHLFLMSYASVRSMPLLSFIGPIFPWNVPLNL